MATTVTNTNPISITGGTMTNGARATIYPGQIARSFKVLQVQLIAGNTSSSVVIQDNSSAGNVLLNLHATVAGTNTMQFDPPVTWADWKVTTLTNTSDTVYVFIK